jgi:hypothetical protein
MHETILGNSLKWRLQSSVVGTILVQRFHKVEQVYRHFQKVL